MSKIGLILGFRSHKKSLCEFPQCRITSTADMALARSLASQAVYEGSPENFNAANLMLLCSRRPLGESFADYEKFCDAMREREAVRLKVAERKPLAPKEIADRIYARVMERRRNREL